MKRIVFSLLLVLVFCAFNNGVAEAGSDVWFCTEADCTFHVSFGDGYSQSLSCGQQIVFTDMPAGEHAAIIGNECGEQISGAFVDADGYSTYFRYIDPVNTSFDCCPTGCDIGGAFVSSVCQGNPTTTTSSGSTTSTPSGNVVIKNHMMTKDPKPDSNCTIPVHTDTFTHEDETANCWFNWENALPTDEITCQWYKPNGEMYTEQSTPATYSNACWFSYISINGSSPAYISGNWRVDVLFDGDKKFTEYFTIVGLDPISSTTSSSSTTTSTYSSDPCPMYLIYGTDSPETQLLRYIRDNVLSQTHEGRELIKLYYQWSPVIVKAMETDDEFKDDVKELVDEIMGMVE